MFCQMRVAKLTTETGYTWSTNVNGTSQEICKYFLGQRFDCGSYKNEDMQVCVKCVIDGKVHDLTPA